MRLRLFLTFCATLAFAHCKQPDTAPAPPPALPVAKDAAPRGLPSPEESMHALPHDDVDDQPAEASKAQPTESSKAQPTAARSTKKVDEPRAAGPAVTDGEKRSVSKHAPPGIDEEALLQELKANKTSMEEILRRTSPETDVLAAPPGAASIKQGRGP